MTGVQIQEEVLNELHRSQESAYNLRDAARQSHLSRAKMCSKVIKYPHVEDYIVSALSSFPGCVLKLLIKLALKEHDQKQLYVARQNLFDIRNVYAILTDIMHKNINKVRYSICRAWFSLSQFNCAAPVAEGQQRNRNVLRRPGPQPRRIEKFPDVILRWVVHVTIRAFHARTDDPLYIIVIALTSTLSRGKDIHVHVPG